MFDVCGFALATDGVDDIPRAAARVLPDRATLEDRNERAGPRETGSVRCTYVVFGVGDRGRRQTDGGERREGRRARCAPVVRPLYHHSEHALTQLLT